MTPRFIGRLVLLFGLVVWGQGCEKKRANGLDIKPAIQLRSLRVVASKASDDIASSACPDGSFSAKLAEKLRRKLAAERFWWRPGQRDVTAVDSVSRAKDVFVDFVFAFECEPIEVADRGLARIMVFFRATGGPKNLTPAHLTERFQAGAEFPYELTEKTNRRAIFEGLLERLLSDLVAQYASRQNIWLGPPRYAIAALAQNEDLDLLVEAAQAVGVRKIQGQLGRLKQLLVHETEGVRDAALGAALKLNAKETVQIMGKSTDFGDHREMRKVITVMSGIGGEDAKRYLDLVASGHPDEEIRQMAASALKRVSENAHFETARLADVVRRGRINRPLFAPYSPLLALGGRTNMRLRPAITLWSQARSSFVANWSTPSTSRPAALF